MLNLLVASVMLVGLSACAPEPDTSGGSSSSPSPSSAPTTSEEPSAEPSATPEPGPVVIPGCEEMVPLDVAQSVLGPGFVYFPDEPSFHESLLSTLGPSAREAVDQAVQSSFCLWAMPQSDGGNSMLVAELPADVREKFLGELRSSDFVEADLDGAPTFVWESDVKYGPRFVWYGFADDLVVVSIALTSDGGVGAPALAHLASANVN